MGIVAGGWMLQKNGQKVPFERLKESSAFLGVSFVVTIAVSVISYILGTHRDKKILRIS